MASTTAAIPFWLVILLGMAGLGLAAAGLVLALSVMRELFRQAQVFAIWSFDRLMVAGVAVTKGSVAGLQLLLKAIAVGILWITAPLAERSLKGWHRGCAELNLAYAYVTKGRKTSANFTEFRSSMADDEEMKDFKKGQKAAPDREELPAYERALQVMGLTREEAASMPKVKTRYRQLMAICHPDRGFPNQTFAQQVNEAMDVIRREHGFAS